MIWLNESFCCGAGVSILRHYSIPMLARLLIGSPETVLSALIECE
jgi:hypothetical protein